MGDFERRAVAVTGAASGIGFEVASHLVRLGAHVYAIDSSALGLQRLSKNTVRSTALIPMERDISNGDDVRAVFARIGEDGGPLDGLVNAAGIVVTANFLEFDSRDRERTFAVNVVGSYLALKHAAPLLASASTGYVVNFLSIAGSSPGSSRRRTRPARPLSSAPRAGRLLHSPRRSPSTVFALRHRYADVGAAEPRPSCHRCTH